MDAVKSVDSVEPLVSTRANPLHKPLASPKGNELSTFAQLLKKASPSSQNTTVSAPLSSPQCASCPPECDAASRGFEWGLEPTFASPSSGFPRDPAETDQAEDGANPPALSLLSPPPNVGVPMPQTASGPLEPIGFQLPDVVVQEDHINVTEPVMTSTEVEPRFEVQTSIEPSHVTGPIAAGEIAMVVISGIIPLEQTPQVRPSSDALNPLPVEQTPLADFPTLVALGTTRAPAMGESEYRIQASSSQPAVHPAAELGNPLGAQGSFEIPFSAGKAEAISSEPLDFSRLAEGKEATIPRTESAAQEPKQHAMPSAQAPQVPSRSGRIEPSVPVTGFVSPDQSEANRAEILADRIGTTISQAANGGKVLRMRLHPPELGVLQIEVRTAEGVVTARLDMENAKAHRAILENLPQLHEMLSRTHTQVDRIELNILEFQEGTEGQPRPFGQSASDRNSSDERVLPQVPILNEHNDSRADRDSLGKSRQTEDWRSRSLPLSGIDIQV